MDVIILNVNENIGIRHCGRHSNALKIRMNIEYSTCSSCKYKMLLDTFQTAIPTECV